MILIFIYMLIGVFIVGYLDEEEPIIRAVILFLWPILIATIMVAVIVSTIYDLGQKVADWMEE